MAGRVDAIGSKVTRFTTGDAVFGCCRGAIAEYASAREDALASMPANLSFDEAAAVPTSAVTASSKASATTDASARARRS